MSLSLVRSRALLGLDAARVEVEVHLANGLPSFTLVGLADVEVKEARERVRSALLTCGLDFPHNKRITVNLAPADLPKVERDNSVLKRTMFPEALGSDIWSCSRTSCRAVAAVVKCSNGAVFPKCGLGPATAAGSSFLAGTAENPGHKGPVLSSFALPPAGGITNAPEALRVKPNSREVHLEPAALMDGSDSLEVSTRRSGVSGWARSHRSQVDAIERFRGNLVASSKRRPRRLSSPEKASPAGRKSAVRGCRACTRFVNILACQVADAQ